MIFESFRAKYRPVRYFVWIGICFLVFSAFVILLHVIFHPPFWVLCVSVGALGLVMPDPKWVRK